VVPAVLPVDIERRFFVLEVRNLTAGYGDNVVLRDVTLKVPDNHVVALLGPNGAGKTTLLRAASGLLAIRAGQVVLDGEDVTGSPMYLMARRGVCHVPEGRGIFPSMTVAENLTLFAPKGQESDSLQRATDIFPVLGQRCQQTAGSLSGGEQQMLAIVRAYLCHPRVVLVDEASMGLAPLIVDQLFEFLGRIASEGTALLLVEQYVNRALAIADDVYLINRGEVVFTGPAHSIGGDEIFERYLGIEVGLTSRASDVGTAAPSEPK
jgi:branched-chain amino acid transport system ATP-binding protein